MVCFLCVHPEKKSCSHSNASHLSFQKREIGSDMQNNKKNYDVITKRKLVFILHTKKTAGEAVFFSLFFVHQKNEPVFL